LSRTPPTLRHTGRALGADNAEVYGELLGLDAGQLSAYAARGVV
jgi:hypothetical protein